MWRPSTRAWTENICIEEMCTYVTSLIPLMCMDRFDFQEAVLAEYIQLVSLYSREELLSELLDVKLVQLTHFSDDELVNELHVQRRKQGS